MQILLITLFFVFLVFLLSAIIQFLLKQNVILKWLEESNLQNKVFNKKTPSASVEKFHLTFRLVGLAITLAFILVSIELFAEKERSVSPVSTIDVFEEVHYVMEEPEIETYIPPEKAVPPPPPPPIPEIPIIEEVETEVEEVELISEEIKLPPPPAIPTATTERPKEKEIAPPPPPKIEPNLETEILNIAQEMPNYPGGEAALIQEIRRAYDVPREFTRSGASAGQIVLRFVVLENGTVGEVQVIKGIEDCNSCSEEAIEVIGNLGQDFSPGKQAGKPVKVWFTVPIKLQVK